jgi:DNA repair protein RecO (recombination protein O)
LDSNGKNNRIVLSITHKTKAIILRSVAYGDTSLIVTALTEIFGIQSYLVKGVRKATKTQSAKANFFQPAALLEMVVYHNPLKQLNFVKEFKWATLYQHIFSNVVKNAIALYTIELLQKCLKEPDDNPALFYFAEDVLLAIDEANTTVTANLPIYISLQLPNLLGVQIIDNYTDTNSILDLKDGCFYEHHPAHQYVVEMPYSKMISDYIKAIHPNDLNDLQLNGNTRKIILDSLEIFYQLHITDFGKIKTLPILREILS